jgi:hypothetical protein
MNFPGIAIPDGCICERLSAIRIKKRSRNVLSH